MSHATETAGKANEREQLRQELLRRIVESEAQRRSQTKAEK
jgi:hypothetical protein